MHKLKSKLNLKIQIPLNKDEECKNIEDNKKSITEIIDNIYISGYLIAEDINYLLKNKFTHIINCSHGSSLLSINHQKNIPKNINYLLISLRDDPSDDIIQKILEIINFIENDKKEKKILFHCIEGVSRGPALAAGYLMWKKNISKNEAINIISSKRKCIDINLGFSIQLNKWEKYLQSFSDKINLINNIGFNNDLIKYNVKSFEGDSDIEINKNKIKIHALLQ